MGASKSKIHFRSGVHRELLSVRNGSSWDDEGELNLFSGSDILLSNKFLIRSEDQNQIQNLFVEHRALERGICTRRWSPCDNDAQKIAMTRFKKVSEVEVQRSNRLQRNTFDKLYHLFEPPLPKGVPERLEKIVAHGKIKRGDAVLDVGSGTGILIPIIKQYEPRWIYACDLSVAMLEQLSSKKYPNVETIVADVRDLKLPDRSIDAVFINACYGNIADKEGSFSNLARMMKAGGRMVISHPLGKSFILSGRLRASFPLDKFPEKSEAESLFRPFGFEIDTFIDEPELYILVASRCRQENAVDPVEQL